MKTVAFAHTLHGPLSDFVDKKYKKDLEEIDRLEKLLCRYAVDKGYASILEEYNGEYHLGMENDWFEKIWITLQDHDEYILNTDLANELAC